MRHGALWPLLYTAALYHLFAGALGVCSGIFVLVFFFFNFPRNIFIKTKCRTCKLLCYLTVCLSAEEGSRPNENTRVPAQGLAVWEGERAGAAAAALPSLAGTCTASPSGEQGAPARVSTRVAALPPRRPPSSASPLPPAPAPGPAPQCRPRQGLGGGGGSARGAAGARLAGQERRAARQHERGGGPAERRRRQGQRRQPAQEAAQEGSAGRAGGSRSALDAWLADIAQR